MADSKVYKPGPGLAFRRWWREHQAPRPGERYRPSDECVFEGDVWMREAWQLWKAAWNTATEARSVR